MACAPYFVLLFMNSVLHAVLSTAPPGARYLALKRLDLDLSRLRSLRLRKLQGQDAVFQLGLHFRGVCGNRQTHHAAEGADAALSAQVKRPLILHGLALPLDRKLIAHDGEIEVAQAEARKLELGLEVVLALPEIH